MTVFLQNRHKVSISHNFFLIFPFLSLCVFTQLAGCVQQKQAETPSMEIWTSGNLRLASHADAPRQIYVEARNSAGEPLPISSALKQALAREHFTVVSSPSDAGYILNINILQRGLVNPENLHMLVEDGYGSPARFTGATATGMLVDALLVQRRVPSAKRPGNARLKNISARNVMESAQMRLGGVVMSTSADDADYQSLTRELSRALQAALADETAGQVR